MTYLRREDEQDAWRVGREEMDGKGLMEEACEGIVGSSVADQGRKAWDGIEEKERRARACRK